jgi:hypothetical protein
MRPGGSLPTLVNYETTLLAVFRAMGDKMPEEFTLVYLW